MNPVFLLHIVWLSRNSSLWPQSPFLKKIYAMHRMFWIRLLNKYNLFTDLSWFMGKHIAKNITMLGIESGLSSFHSQKSHSFPFTSLENYLHDKSFKTYLLITICLISIELKIVVKNEAVLHVAWHFNANSRCSWKKEYFVNVKSSPR